MTVSRSKADTIRYVTLADRKLPPEQQSTFLIRPLSNATKGQLDSLVTIATDGSSAMVRTGDQRRAALKAGLIGWENFNDAQGAPTPFETEKGHRSYHGIACTDPPTDDTLERMSEADYREVAAAIMQGSTLTVDDAKN